MAKLPALISLLGSFDPRDAATVENYARKLRSVGHLSPGKRGAGAPVMSTTDASNLLFSLVCRRADDVADSVLYLQLAQLEPSHFERASEFSFFGRAMNADGNVNAINFFSCMLEDMATQKLILKYSDVNYSLNHVQIFDPKTGFGKVEFGFVSQDSEMLMINFNVVADFSDLDENPPPMMIQNSIRVDAYIIWKIVGAVAH